MGQIPFTQQALGKLVGMEGTRLVVHDPKTPGLRAELREGGTLTLYVYRWLGSEGRPIRVKLGTFPELTVDAARIEAAKVLAKIAVGENPTVAKRAKRDEPTIKELFTHWLEHHAKLHKKTWRQDEQQFERYFATLRNRKLSAIAKSDVQAWHAKIGESAGKYAANRALALLRAVFNAADAFAFEGNNPAARVKMYREEKRDRFLQPSELPKFFAAIKADPNEAVRDYFMLCLFTGARRGNVLSMRWADLDLAQALWRIPDTKQGRVHHVPLSEPALAILNRRIKSADASGFVFPSHGKRGHIAETKAGWSRIIERAGLENLRPHDLRRTLGSYQAISGASLAIIGATLGHSQPTTTAIYARLTTNAVAESVSKAAAVIEAAAKPKKPGRRKAVTRG
jgi:integrase